MLKEGGGIFEIDFQQYEISAHSVMYIQPFQVHRVISIYDATFDTLLVSSENLNPEYLKLLKEITPAGPLLLDPETFSIASETGAVCRKLYQRKNEKLHYLMMKDACNSLVGFLMSQFPVLTHRADQPARHEVIAKDFKLLLDQHFLTVKSPSQYAGKLNISAAYLNECLKKSTGQTVSYHIHQRIILEAKRLLFHSGKSVKEIATELGYDDYPYFSRLFTKIAGMTALAFRNKNLG
ncbi:helix-turn-helix domain-containing protein [Chryseobacterium sp. JJR-5R]|uniref:helix-turn-helix domain-containing protein n=1 Tax=Chryseobacterium sp. JJR-5R TaxID=3093923 RepID=UPI002A75CA46|nr:helix-turn-helix domain-containing protein [Chryseobacterium sp. JJR-5R]WPO84270.1 helix-turn-helix domain-containing protein [Chryseobacterium sp. JJR-5R]